jgi:hypothetical protein
MVWKIPKGMKELRIAIPKTIKENFKKFCVLSNKTITQAVCEAISEYLANHQYEVRSNITININTMNVSITKNIYVKAKISENKADLQRLLNIVKNMKDPQAKTDFLVELAKKIQKAYKVYEKTRDPELGELLKQCEKYI